MFYIVAIAMTVIGVLSANLNLLTVAGLFAIAGAIEIHSK